MRISDLLHVLAGNEHADTRFAGTVKDVGKVYILRDENLRFIDNDKRGCALVLGQCKTCFDNAIDLLYPNAAIERLGDSSFDKNELPGLHF